MKDFTDEYLTAVPILTLGQVLRSKSPSDRKGRTIPRNYIETGEGAGFVKVVITEQNARADIY